MMLCDGYGEGCRIREIGRWKRSRLRKNSSELSHRGSRWDSKWRIPIGKCRKRRLELNGCVWILAGIYEGNHCWVGDGLWG